MKKTSSLVILLLAIIIVRYSVSQNNVSGYYFSQSITAYTSINTTGTLVAGSTNCDETTFGGLPIGFNFSYDGNIYSQFGCCCNGYVSLGPAAPYGTYSPLSSGPTNEVLSPFAYDLQLDYTGSIYYQTSGSSPNRICTIEWYRCGFWPNSGYDLSFQVKLFETSGNIEFIYRTIGGGGLDVQVGLRGSSTADYSDRSTDSSWLATTAGSSNTATCRYNHALMPDGLTFIWSQFPLGISGFNAELPKVFRLYPNYPNPFNPSTIIKFDVPKSGELKIVIYNSLGQEISVLANGRFMAGSYSEQWNASGFPSGIYFCKLITEDITEVQKIVLCK